MQGLSYIRSCLMFSVLLVGTSPFVTAQGAGGLFDPHAQLLQSFQNEMKSLEAAAHRVNALLMNPNLSNQVAKPADDQVADNTIADSTPVQKETKEDKNFEFTVLADPSILRSGILKPKQEPTTIPTTAAPVKPIENVQHFNPNPILNFGSFGSLLNSLTNRANFQTPWWRGKNVCVEKSDKVEGEEARNQEAQFIIFGTGSFERCSQTANKYVCTTVVSSSESTKTSTVTYSCCEGFRREGNTCVEVNLKSLMESLKELGATDFASDIEKANLANELSTRNVTVFAYISEEPSVFTATKIRKRAMIEEAWDGVKLNVLPDSVAMKDYVLAHITDSLLDIEDFSNEMVLNSMSNDSLRVNIYPGRQDALVTVNCARLVSWDNLGKNSRIHTIERPLDIVHQSVLDVLQQPQFSQFRNYLEQSNLLSKIENASAVTVFAPTNDAWDQLDENLKASFSQGKGCLDAVLKHHILPLTLCSAAANEGRLTTTDIAGELVRISTNDGGQIIVDKKTKVVESDKVATNGVVHVVDTVLIPQSAKSVSNLLSFSNHTTFLDLLNKAGITENINKADNLTLFVPTERVLNQPETKQLLQNMDKDALKEVLLYHAATVKNPMCDMKDDLQLETMLNGAKLRIDQFDSIPFFSGLVTRTTVQCASLIHTDGKACHAVAHEVDRLLMPPKSSILKLIAENSQLSTFRKILEGTEAEKDLEYQLEQQTSNSGAGYTLLAPSDEAFAKLEEMKLNKLLNDKKFADQTIRKHILPEPLCCSGVSVSPWPFTNSVQTLQGRKLDVNRNRNNQVMFGSSVATECDVIATDGILHIVDKVFIPQSSRAKLGNVIFETPGEKIALIGI